MLFWYIFLFIKMSSEDHEEEAMLLKWQAHAMSSASLFHWESWTQTDPFAQAVQALNELTLHSLLLRKIHLDFSKPLNGLYMQSVKSFYWIELFLFPEFPCSTPFDYLHLILISSKQVPKSFANKIKIVTNSRIKTKALLWPLVTCYHSSILSTVMLRELLSPAQKIVWEKVKPSLAPALLCFGVGHEFCWYFSIYPSLVTSYSFLPHQLPIDLTKKASKPQIWCFPSPES